MLDPGYSLRAISVKRRKPNPWFKRGTVYRRAVDVLRTAERDLTAREMAGRVLAAANVTNPKGRAGGPDWDHQFVTRNHDGKGVVRTNEGSPARWRLAALGASN
jgi:hypothetical protein